MEKKDDNVRPSRPPFMRKFRRSRKRRREKARRRPVNVLASLMTTLSLYCGVVSMFSSIAGDYQKAVYMILAAAVFDLCDGTVARLTNSVTEFGKELDSLCDLVSFGVAPAILVYTAFIPGGVQKGGPMIDGINSVLAILFVICAALRLARYNVYQSGHRDMFTGLATPIAGGTLASFVLLDQYFELGEATWMVGPLVLGLSGLMISRVQYPKDKLKLFMLAPRHAFRILVAAAVVIGLFHYTFHRSPAIVLFPLGLAYIFYGIGDTLLRRFNPRGGEPPEGTPPQEPSAPPEGPVEPEPASNSGELL